MGVDNHFAPCVQGAGDEGGERWGCGLGVGGVGWKYVGWAWTYLEKRKNVTVGSVAYFWQCHTFVRVAQAGCGVMGGVTKLEATRS